MMKQNNSLSGVKRETAKKHLSNVQQARGIEQLLAVMSALRSPDGGCPWDRKQNYASILPFTIEEVYEVAEAIEQKDYESLKDELGDLLFQVVFYAQIAKEEGRFCFNDIIDGIVNKLISRHSHVFSNSEFETEKQLNDAWELVKQQEREEKTQGKASVLDDIPNVLPELKRAYKIQKRVAKQGFDWQHVDQVWDKVNEESEEIKEAVLSGDKSEIEDEVGDLLFAVVNLARHYEVDADIALRRANQKFERRYRHMEGLCKSGVESYSLEQLEVLWQQAKLDLGKEK